MAKVSIIIPARAESADNLHRTLQSIVSNATGEYEIIIGFNGFTETDEIVTESLDYDAEIKYIPFPENIGIKMNINALVATARGKYIYKTDAHCKFSKGFDEILQADMQDDWIVTPRFYVLDGKTWEWQDDRHYDYFYLSCPFTDNRGFRFKAGGHWPQLTAERENKPEYMIDETPQIHGSGWFVNRNYFLDTLGGFPNIDINGHGQEPIWLALKNWLIGGKVMVNKNVWYAHLHQDNSVKGFHFTKEEERHTYDMTARHWMTNKEPNIVHKLDWFIDKFMPMPTWPDNWRELYDKKTL